MLQEATINYIRCTWFGDQNLVHEEFRKQLKETQMVYIQQDYLGKLDILLYLTMLSVQKPCLGELLRKFKGTPEQINQGMVQYTPDKLEGDHVFYMTHKPVIRELAETTKMRIVYDTSARGNQKSPLLNNCLDVGPPLQLLLYDVLL